MASRETRESDLPSRVADLLYAVVGPALIMLMVGSLVFFLVEVFYRGEYRFPAHWVFGLFVFAIVLISRIAIELGTERAYGLGLALAIAVTLHAGIGFPTLLLAVAWWTAAKLTWDCTFVDRSRDVTGQGLVQTAGHAWRRFHSRLRASLDPTRAAALAEEAAGGESSGAAKPSGGQPLSPAELETLERSTTPETRLGFQRWLSELLWRRRNKNTPGLWAFFCFLGGLPIFGIGQLLLRADPDVRRGCVRLFAVYLFAGLSLMMLTSLIGLLRYARSRGARIPDAVVHSWLALGTVFALAVVAVVLVIPRPSRGFSLADWLPQLSTPDRTGSRALISERGKTPDKSGSGRNDPQGAPGAGDRQPAEKEGNRGAAGGTKSGQQAQRPSRSDQGGQAPGGKSQRKAGGEASPPPRGGPSWWQTLSEWLKSVVLWLVAAAALLVGFYFLVRDPRRWISVLKSWVEGFFAWWASLWARKARPVAPTAARPMESRRRAERPWNSYANPFSARGLTMPANQAVEQTFAALQALARELREPRLDDETVYEFTRRLARRHPPLSDGAETLADLYSQAAYAGTQLDAQAVRKLEGLWGAMGTLAPSVAAAPRAAEAAAR